MSFSYRVYEYYVLGTPPPPAPQSLTGDLYDDVVHDPLLVPVTDPVTGAERAGDAFLADFALPDYYVLEPGLLRKFDVPAEWGGGIARLFDVPAEWGGGLLRVFDVPAEWGGGIARLFDVPVDFTGAAIIERVFDVPAEWSGVLSRVFDVPAEWSAGLGRRFDLPAEWGGRNALTLPVRWDVLNELVQPLPVLFDVLSGGLVARLPVRFSVVERIAPLPVTWRVIPDLLPLFSADVQQPYGKVTETE